MNRRVGFHFYLSVMPLMVALGCSPTYEEKSDYLETIAQRGVETNKIIQDQENREASEEVCSDAHIALNTDYPRELQTSEEWDNLVKETFVSACMTGRY
ncbi:hypothetical protein GCM10009605_49310 [Nocardiopsis composta]